MRTRAAHSNGGAEEQGDPPFVRAALRLYPAHWRDRYGEEFAVLLTDTTAATPCPGGSAGCS